uniref:Phosducin domain-containing protein n=1 Tax=Phaeomonas parva TaxID=124430 RepID=A0A7S1TUC9_9STRA|mmetsp:Transcript_18280/g.55845  ORF Transcript_18280/g.55845 Transcript_18280/m.55845 type:complete len:256 (+) Transcript_18280:55-822(+)
MATGGTTKTKFTLKTTDFDDALMKHGIISREQALIAKGMTVAEANALLEEEHRQKHELDGVEYHTTTGAAAAELRAKAAAAVDAAAEDSDDALLEELEDELDDDAMLNEYRAKRMAEMRAAAATQRYGDYVEIRRDEWMREVNDASTDAFVVVNLYQDALESTLVVDHVLGELAGLHRDVKFLRIKSTEAIEGFPDGNLPVIFVYRDGEMATQLDSAELIEAGQLTTLSIGRALERAGVLKLRTGRRATDGGDDD